MSHDEVENDKEDDENNSDDNVDWRCWEVSNLVNVGRIKAQTGTHTPCKYNSRHTEITKHTNALYNSSNAQIYRANCRVVGPL